MSSGLTLMKQKRKIGHTFHIRIGPHAQKLNIKDPDFLKLLEQEYATKYLENLGVEATQKNINKILKQNPLETCEIIQSRMMGGLHTDTITIIAKSTDSSQNKKIETQNVSGEMLQMLNLKRMNVKRQIAENSSQQINELQKKQKQKESQSQSLLQYLSFDLKSIKQRYIFPFNQNFKRKSNYRMKDSSNLLDSDKQDSNIIFQSKIFHFPFTQVKLSIKCLKELQTPITSKFVDISNFIDKFCLQFPKHIFPVSQAKKIKTKQNFNTIFQKTEKIIENSNKKSDMQKYYYLIFTSKDVDRTFQLIKSQQNVKLIGVFLHLAYWTIFGGVNPIQVDRGMKKKMYIMMFQTLEYFEIKMENRKIWTTLTLPMILLTLKMGAHYFFTTQYPKLFQSEESIKVNAHELAIDKILYLVEKLFDQGNINGRFIFLQSDIDGEKGNFTKDKKFIRKRIFGTSPALALILPGPKDGKTRSIMAKNMQIDQQDGTIEDKRSRKEQVDKESQQKLLNLALHKINNRIEELMGHQNNPILNLKTQ